MTGQLFLDTEPDPEDVHERVAEVKPRAVGEAPVGGRALLDRHALRRPCSGRWVARRGQAGWRLRCRPCGTWGCSFEQEVDGVVAVVRGGGHRAVGCTSRRLRDRERRPCGTRWLCLRVNSSRRRRYAEVVVSGGVACMGSPSAEVTSAGGVGARRCSRRVVSGGLPADGRRGFGEDT
jgi:hypothetical protein